MFDFLKKIFKGDEPVVDVQEVVEEKVKPSKLNKTALNKMKKAELVDYAKKQGVDVGSKDTKKQIIEKLV